MRVFNRDGRWTERTAAGLMLLALASGGGCQVDIGGQTLPSPYWHSDDVQYFPPYAEFKLAREAAAMEAQREEEARLGRPAGQPAGMNGGAEPGMEPIPADAAQ